MKKIIAIALAIICLIPAAGITSPFAAGPVAVATSGSDKQSSGAELMPAEEMIKDEDLTKISGQSSNGLLPWGGLVTEMDMVVSRIKLWDEADRSTIKIDVSRAPGTTQNTFLPAVGQAFTGFCSQ